jgi:hypothetical protein
MSVFIGANDQKYLKTSARKFAPMTENSGPRMSEQALWTFGMSTIVSIEVPEPIPPTPEEIDAKRERTMRRTIQDSFTNSKHEFESFKKNFEKSPVYAFTYSTDRCMQAAAKYEVAAMVESILNSDKGGLEAAISEARHRALRGAVYPSFSTSPTSNLVEMFRTQAWAEFVARDNDARGTRS